MTDDDELFARMRDADPAASLPPAGPDRVARLLEDAMSHETITESRETGTRGRSPLTWLVAAAAALVIVGVGAVALGLGGDEEPHPAPPAAQEPTVTALRMPDTGAARCMVPNAQALANADLAVDAVVVSIGSGVVTLEPSHWYAGEPTEQVEVDQSSADLSALIGAPRFEDGGRYLVAGSDDGDVMVCGFSGAYTDDLAALYTEAFGS